MPACHGFHTALFLATVSAAVHFRSPHSTAYSDCFTAAGTDMGSTLPFAAYRWVMPFLLPPAPTILRLGWNHALCRDHCRRYEQIVIFTILHTARSLAITPLYIHILLSPRAYCQLIPARIPPASLPRAIVIDSIGSTPTLFMPPPSTCCYRYLPLRSTFGPLVYAVPPY